MLRAEHSLELKFASLTFPVTVAYRPLLASAHPTRAAGAAADRSPPGAAETTPQSPGHSWCPGDFFSSWQEIGKTVRLRLASWNINSVRLRVGQVARFVAEQEPDVVCLQEIKCQEAEFPSEAFAAAGLPHLRISGQKGWHGVAIASRLPIADAPDLDVCRHKHARCVSGIVAGIEIQNFYVPAGGDIPDRSANPKFDHKLDFFERMTAEMARRDQKAPLVVAGDLNVAPGENDVWNHRFMSRVVSHTPAEVAAMEALKASLGFIDLAREAARSRKSCFRGGVIAPPIFAPRTAVCAWTTSGSLPGCAPRLFTSASPAPGFTMASAHGTGRATTRR